MAGAGSRARALPWVGALLLGLASGAWAGAPVRLALLEEGVHRAPDGHLLVWVAVHNPAATPAVTEVSVAGSPVVHRLTLPGLAHRDLLLFTDLDPGPMEIAARTDGGDTVHLPPLPLPPRPAARTCATVGAVHAPTAARPAGWEAAVLPGLPNHWGPYLAYPLWLVAEEAIAHASERQRTAMAAATAAGARIAVVSSGGAVRLPPISGPRPLLPKPTAPSPPFPATLATTLTRAAAWQGGGALCLALLGFSGVPARRAVLLAGAVIIALGTASPLLYPRATVGIVYSPVADGRLEEASVTVSGGDTGQRVAASGHAWLPLAAAPGLRWIAAENDLVLEQAGRLAAPATARAIAIGRDAGGPSHLREMGRGG